MQIVPKRFIDYNKKLKQRSRNLRNKSTLSEVLIWNQLKASKMKGYKFNRQKPLGYYIVDFYCKKLNLVIEIDGESHLNKYEEDKKRQKKVRSQDTGQSKKKDRGKQDKPQLKKKTDEAEVKEAARNKEVKILELIDGSKLKDKKEFVTPRFLESLREAKDETDIKVLIDDRVKLIEQSREGIKGMGDEGDTEDEQTKEVLEAKKKEYEVALNG